MVQVAFFLGDNRRGPAHVNHVHCDAALQVRHRACRRRSLAACQSAPAQAARLAPVHRVFWSGLRLDVPGEEIVAGMECRSLLGGFFKVGIAVGTQATPSSRPRPFLVAEVRDCAKCSVGRRLAPPCLVHGQVVEGAVEDGAGKSGARLRLDAALEAAEDGHVAGLQVRRASWREEPQYDVWESGLQGGLAGVGAGHVPRRMSFLLGFSTSSGRL